jgi:tRNA(Ile)-lysidine synthase
VPVADHPVSEAETDVLFADLADARSLLLAVSGGPDSTALLALAARWRKRLARGPNLIAVTIDHGLRPEARREAAAVKRLAASLGVPHRTLRWVDAKPRTGVQEKARLARYDLLRREAHRHGARHVVTAHTLDDQAETILFRMARGSGLAGLAGMARATAQADDMLLVRPFLRLPKARLLATLKAQALPFIDDPSNRDPRFARARLRPLIGQLAAEGLDADRLALLALRMRRAGRRRGSGRTRQARGVHGGAGRGRGRGALPTHAGRRHGHPGPRPHRGGARPGAQKAVKTAKPPQIVAMLPHKRGFGDVSWPRGGRSL